jgi:hypothetical protein
VVVLAVLLINQVLLLFLNGRLSISSYKFCMLSIELLSLDSLKTFLSYFFFSQTLAASQ